MEEGEKKNYRQKFFEQRLEGLCQNRNRQKYRVDSQGNWDEL